MRKRYLDGMLRLRYHPIVRQVSCNGVRYTGCCSHGPVRGSYYREHGCSTSCLHYRTLAAAAVCLLQHSTRPNSTCVSRLRFKSCCLPLPDDTSGIFGAERTAVPCQSREWQHVHAHAAYAVRNTASPGCAFDNSTSIDPTSRLVGR